MSNVRLWEPEWDRAFWLGDRRVDPAARRIDTNGAGVDVEPRIMAVLIVLAQRQDEIIRREDLIEKVWNGASGADQSLSNAISVLRRALGDIGRERNIIQTVPKQGYRLLVPVKRSADVSTEDEDIAQAPPVPMKRASIWTLSPQRYILVFLLLSLFAATTYFAVPKSETPPLDIADQTTQTVIDPMSIAVLPFANMSSDPDNDYFSDGLAEEILNALAQFDELKVASRTDSFRFDKSDESISEISRQLRVANVLEGSVRRDGDQIRITAQLIAAEDGKHLWSSVYDEGYEDIFSVQQDIALNIAGALLNEITDADRDRLGTPPTDNLEAYNHYLIGMYQLQRWNVDDNRRAVQSFERSVALDPEFAQAQLGLGRAYYFAGTHYGWMSPKEAIPKVKSSLVYGMGSSNPVVHASALSIYGDVLAWNDRDWSAALAAYKRAYEISGKPSLGYGLTNSIVAEHDTAIRIFEELLRHNGDDIAVRNNLAWALFNARRYEAALVEAERVIEADATFADGYRVVGRARLLLGDINGAIEAFVDASRLMNGAPVARSDLAVAYARANMNDEARAILQELETASEYVPAPLRAQIYANLDEADAAIAALSKGVEDGARGVIFLKINPMYDPVRSDSRFSDLLAQLNLR